MSRYDKRRILFNDYSQYSEILRNRGINVIKHFSTPMLKYPTDEEIQDLQLLGHRWSLGDRLWKLAEEYYGDSTLWFIIAWFNQKPTECHIEIGDTIWVPQPLDRIMKYLGL